MAVVYSHLIHPGFPLHRYSLLVVAPESLSFLGHILLLFLISKPYNFGSTSSLHASQAISSNFALLRWINIRCNHRNNPNARHLNAKTRSSSLSIPSESINFDSVYPFHSFAATVEGQPSIVKGDNLFLMDNTNSYWWLVRVLKTQDVGYIPAENIEAPFERLGHDYLLARPCHSAGTARRRRTRPK
ncbi:hypothetical protein HYDPIDRAFT_119091 [Hydnomerulius pinastri MD-312]|uniref:SH3 domain-containing protein n=1 Tax=Hydnomerulius pinastri MD-312 TaxID=994086 RepID=A0A0C9VZC9_9AGAM|nr:hypothetical protein HYDPIDRAFT_119091 [Hydnomerulius pinastri MD-312]